jgi:hypothetical protein
MSLALAAAAATAADVNKTALSLLRAIKAGKVSGKRNERRRVAGAELYRICPLAAQRGDTEAPHYHAAAALEAEIAGLRQVAELLRRQLEATRQDRDRWAEAATAALRTLTPAKSRRFW